MKSARELLELAAKAAGIKGEWSESYKSFHDDTALLRQALGQLECNTENMSKGMSKSIQKLCARENREVITALRERLGST